jgi:hypothetical protein
MKIFGALVLTAAAVSAVVAGCAQKRTQSVAVSASPKAAPVPPPQPTEEVVREKRPRFGESAVYVDGNAVGVIRSTELPAKLKGRLINWPGGYTTTSYGFVDYVRALGVDAKKIKALHLYGGKRVVVVDRAELTRIGEGITFAFVHGNRGKVRVNWPPTKLNTNTTIDMVTNVAFYLEKEAPVLKGGDLVMPDGSPVGSKVPYAPEEQGSGTRVYVDGTLVGAVKRKKITNDMIVADTNKAKAAAGEDSRNAAPNATPNATTDDGVDRFSLLSYAAKLRPDAKQIKSLDLVAGDDVVAHVDADMARTIAFHVPAHNRGQAVVNVPTANGIRPARITAVQIYVNSTPPSRPVVAVDEASEAGIGNGGQGQGGGGGSGSDEDL